MFNIRNGELGILSQTKYWLQTTFEQETFHPHQSINQSTINRICSPFHKYLNSGDFSTIGIFSNAFVWFSKCICCGLNSLGWPLWRQLCSKVLLAGKKCLQQNFLTLMAQRVEFVKNWKYDSWKVWIVLWLCWVKSSNPIKDP